MSHDPDAAAARRKATPLLFALPLSITALAISLVVYAHAARSSHADEAYEQADRFFAIKQQIESRYVIEKDSWDLLYRAIEGMVQSLDEYSRFYRPALAARFDEETTGEYGGIGVVIHTEAPPITIRFPYPEGPAYKAGIRPGDRITHVNDKSIEEIGADGAQKLIKGKPGTSVRLRIARAGTGATQDVELERAVIVQGTVFEAHLVDVEHGIGYLRVHSFQKDTANEFHARVDQLIAQGAHALIVDLRQNSGGLFDQARDMANAFVKEGVLVSLRGRVPGSDQDSLADASKFFYADLPLVLLIDQDTASAAEVLAGALQDYKRALLLGTRSYGKGVVQSVIPIRMRDDEQGVLKLTTAEYVTPGGQHIERHIAQSEASRGGLKPDYEVALGADLDALRERFEQQRIPDEFRAQVLQMMKATVPQVDDQQLAAAIKLLRGEPVFRDLTVRPELPERTAGR
ncbi:MAG: S41 family peptidase [Planctomycetota bacterium]